MYGIYWITLYMPCRLTDGLTRLAPLSQLSTLSKSSPSRYSSEIWEQSNPAWRDLHHWTARWRFY